MVPDYQELILILNHLNHDNLLYVRLSKIKKSMYAHCRRYVKQRKRTQPFFSAIGNCNKVQHLHHLYNPHVAGIYGPFNDKVIEDSTLPINKAFVHNPIHPLLASSENRIDLIYVPSLYSAFDSWKQCLTEEEIVVTSNLKIACNDSHLILDFQLNEKFTIRTAIDALLKIKTEYHHDVLHLRYCYHTISMCAEVHNFTSNCKTKIVKKGVVTQQGMVKMVCLVLLKNSLKKVFSKLLIAFAKIAEYYLLHLPDDLFEHRLPNAG